MGRGRAGGNRDRDSYRCCLRSFRAIWSYPPTGCVERAVVTAFAASALGFFVQTYAQRHAPPARTALILASEPAFAGLFAYLLKGETLGTLDWTGAVLILGAIVAVEAVPRLRTGRPPAPRGLSGSYGRHRHLLPFPGLQLRPVQQLLASQIVPLRLPVHSLSLRMQSTA